MITTLAERYRALEFPSLCLNMIRSEGYFTHVQASIAQAWTLMLLRTISRKILHEVFPSYHLLFGSQDHHENCSVGLSGHQKQNHIKVASLALLPLLLYDEASHFRIYSGRPTDLSCSSGLPYVG